MTTSYFVTHPDVVIDPKTPIPEWGLSPKGFERIKAFCGRSLLDEVDDVFVSDERKALDCAETLQARRGSSFEIHSGLRENAARRWDMSRHLASGTSWTASSLIRS